jgi:hypothetical protein
MHTQTRSFRLATALAVSSLVLAQSLPTPALAQGAPPPSQQAGVPDQQAGDPPARVGRLARISGTVSFHGEGQDQWSPAIANYPVTADDAFWTQPDAQAVIQVSASRIVMAPSTELDTDTLSDSQFQGTTPQGELYLHLVPAGQAESYAVQTPRGLATLAVPGRYSIIAGDTEHPTLVTVVEGSAHIEGPGISLDVGPEQTATIIGTDAFQGELGPAQHDPFLTAALSSDRRPVAAPPRAVAALPGGDDLAQYGTWAQSPDYGQVWYPQVATDWVPYREGNWAYVEPWGWTWVDSSPWGFAPFHYGRWVDVDGRWGWVPGEAPGAPVGAPVPVYAPALVTFLGIGAGVALGVGIGAALAEGRVGWCPLGPREPYHPWYRASDRYFRQVNVRNVSNVTVINRNVTINNFANRGAATVVPAAVMTGSRPVAPSVQRLDPAQFAQVRPVIGQQPLRPTTATLGVTPTVARQLDLPQTAPSVQRIAPGPSIHGAPFVATGATPGVPPGAIVGDRPPLHAPGQMPAAMTQPMIRPPALRTPPAPGQIAPPLIEHNAGTLPAIVHPPPPSGNRPEPPPGGIAHSAPPIVTQPPVIHHPPAQPYMPPNLPAHVTERVEPPVVAHTPPPEVHMPPPVVHTPPVMVQAARPPPPPQVRPPPPPPAPHPPPPAHNEPHKRPGEP